MLYIFLGILLHIGTTAGEVDFDDFEPAPEVQFESHTGEIMSYLRVPEIQKYDYLMDTRLDYVAETERPIPTRSPKKNTQFNKKSSSSGKKGTLNTDELSHTGSRNAASRGISRRKQSNWNLDSDEDSLESLEMGSSEEQETCYCPCLNKRKSKLKQNGRRQNIQSSEEDEDFNSYESSSRKIEKNQKGRLFFRG